MNTRASWADPRKKKDWEVSMRLNINGYNFVTTKYANLTDQQTEWLIGKLLNHNHFKRVTRVRDHIVEVAAVGEYHYLNTVNNKNTIKINSGGT